MSKYDEMTPEIMASLLYDEAFKYVLTESLKESELVAGFSHLYGIRPPAIPSTPIAALVDEATGYRQQQWNNFLRAFSPFVYWAIYMPLAERAN